MVTEKARINSFINQEPLLSVEERPKRAWIEHVTRLDNIAKVILAGQLGADEDGKGTENLGMETLKSEQDVVFPQ